MKKSVLTPNTVAYVNENLDLTLEVINVFVQTGRNSIPEFMFEGFQDAIKAAEQDGLVIIENGNVSITKKALTKIHTLIELGRQDGVFAPRKTH